MTKTLKQYLSLRGLLARRLIKKKKEVKTIKDLLEEYTNVERMIAYCRGNTQVKMFLIYHQKANSGKFMNFTVQFEGLQEYHVSRIEELYLLNSASEKIKFHARAC